MHASLPWYHDRVPAMGAEHARLRAAAANSRLPQCALEHRPPHHPSPAPPPQLYCLPDLDLHSSACRFTLPGRTVAFGGKDGNMLAAAGDDGTIRLVSAAEGKVGQGGLSHSR